MAAVTL